MQTLTSGSWLAQAAEFPRVYLSRETPPTQRGLEAGGLLQADPTVPPVARAALPALAVLLQIPVGFCPMGQCAAQVPAAVFVHATVLHAVMMCSAPPGDAGAGARGGRRLVWFAQLIDSVNKSS